MGTFQLVKVKGATPTERGRQYGVQARDKIRAGIESYRELFAKTLSHTWEETRQYALSYVPLIRQRMPEVLEEAEGIALGAGVDFGDLMVVNCRYEITKFPREKECTTAAILPEASQGGKTLLVKNWDLRIGVIDNIVVLSIEEPDGTCVLGLTEAGQLMREGFNSHGVGLCNNSLQSVYDTRGVGIPVTFLRRKVLASKTFDEAKELLLTATRSVSNNMLLASSDGRAVDIEAHPKGADIIEPSEGIVTHANHFVVNKDLNALGASPRGDRLRELLMRKHGEITVPYIKECMSDHENYPHAICRHPADVSVPRAMRSGTVASLIIDFQERTAHICAGPPCQGEFVEYTFETGV